MLKLFRLLKPFRIPIVFVFVLVFLQSLANLYLPTLTPTWKADGSMDSKGPGFQTVGKSNVNASCPMRSSGEPAVTPVMRTSHPTASAGTSTRKN